MLLHDSPPPAPSYPACLLAGPFGLAPLPCPLRPPRSLCLSLFFAQKSVLCFHTLAHSFIFRILYPFVCHSYENNRGGYQQFPKWNIPAPAGTPFWLTSPTSSCTATAPLTAKRSPMTLTPKKTRLRVPGSKSSPTSHAPTARKMTW